MNYCTPVFFLIPVFLSSVDFRIVFLSVEGAIVRREFFYRAAEFPRDLVWFFLFVFGDSESCHLDYSLVQCGTL